MLRYFIYKDNKQIHVKVAKTLKESSEKIENKL